MSVISVLTAMKTRWDAESLDSTITGGMSFGQSKKKSDPPYAEMLHIGTSREDMASKLNGNNTDYEEHEIRFTVHSRGGPVAAGALVDAIRSAFDRAPLSISDGDVITCRREGANITMEVEDDIPGAIVSVITYVVLTAVSRAASPT